MLDMHELIYHIPWVESDSHSFSFLENDNRNPNEETYKDHMLNVCVMRSKGFQL